jgi:aminoglycoside/choline kinase family phosphotransferase
MDRETDSRYAALKTWLAQFEGLGDSRLQPASGDASLRRYFRLTHGSASYIAMDAPPPNESCRSFVRNAGYLESMGLNGPRILGADFDDGFVLMTDLGPTQYLDALETEPESADRLYTDAMDALLRLQEAGEVYQQNLPVYDYEFVAMELDIFRDWLCRRHLGIDFSSEDDAHWKHCCELLIDNALRQKQVFMHRDFHSRNLMLTAVNNPGILDFQDAVEGPLTYDLVSLLKDCYIKWPAGEIEKWALQFHARLSSVTRDELDADRFLQQFHLMGVQRHLKASGIFARLYHRDAKPAYLDDIPRTLEYVSESAAMNTDLAFLSDLIGQRILPALRAAE